MNLSMFSEPIIKKLETPFRYPGAKTRLQEQIIEALKPSIKKTTTFIDAFVGGGSIAIAAFNSFPNLKKIIVNDYDKAVASFWQTIINKQYSDVLSELINSTTVDVETFKYIKEEMSNLNNPVFKLGFYALFINRTSFSGILTSGPIGGNKQESKYTVDCRYNKDVLTKRVKELNEYLGPKLEAYNYDAISLIKKFDDDKNVFYFDPPYYHKGDELYRIKMSHSDHAQLSKIIKNMQSPWVLSYDACPEIKSLYKWANIKEIGAGYSISGKSRKSWNNKKELIITNG